MTSRGTALPLRVRPAVDDLSHSCIEMAAMTSSERRLPRGFHWLIAAQFSSALADNALLIVTIALLQEQGLPGWWAPLLKFGFTLSYVFLAPFVGPLADAFAKARLMAWMNAVKAFGVLALLAGVQRCWPSSWWVSARRRMRRPNTA
jgi:MFS family permease